MTSTVMTTMARRHFAIWMAPMSNEPGRGSGTARYRPPISPRTDSRIASPSAYVPSIAMTGAA